MPTTLTRIQVTLTPPVAGALEVAEREWPGVPRAELVGRLLARGAEAIEASRAERQRERRRALEETRGVFGEDVFPPDYLEQLRQDWPD